MRILVFGGRDFKDYKSLKRALYEALGDHGIYEYSQVVIISGLARGADTLAKMFAKEFGCKYLGFLADWEQYGKAAGVIRNQQMLDEGNPDIAVGCPGSTGTADMKRRVLKAGVPLYEL